LDVAPRLHEQLHDQKNITWLPIGHQALSKDNGLELPSWLVI